jgi:intracellular sulfur oxidation DsrE/DsrF family protein
MMRIFALLLIPLLEAVIAASPAHAQMGTPNAPVIPEAYGWVTISKAALPPDRTRVYRAIYDATLLAKEPTQLVPALNMSGAMLNALAVSGISLTNARFVVIFHGPAINGILDDAHYRAKFGVANPNLTVLTQLRQAGVELFVCGQNLAAENIDAGTLSPDVTVASAAPIVLMMYQNDGYALMNF